MDNLNKYQQMEHVEISKSSIVTSYNGLFIGKRKVLPRGTWELDKNVILIVRYALEIKLQLVGSEIPKVNRQIIKEQKLWGALNRFKSIPKLIKFVYGDKFNEFDFSRVPVNYWNNLKNIKNRLEYYLKKNNLTINDIPTIISYNQLVEWGFSNPLKHFNHSPYALINNLYPNKFYPYQFRKLPQRTANNKEQQKRHFMKMLRIEEIDFKDVPRYVTQELLIKYRFSGALKYYENSPSRFVTSLFPNQFHMNQFNKKQGHWKNIHNVKEAITDLIKKEKIPHNNIPSLLTKQLLKKHDLNGLLHQYNGSPIKIINEIYPNEFCVTDFKRVPNRFWFDNENRINALRAYCKKNNIKRNYLPNLTRAYFSKNFPRFISIADRHYESRFHLWIIEAFPEHNLKQEEFNLHIGIDGRYCDSKEELIIHNYLVSNLINAYIYKERSYFTNNIEEETYIPDWIIEQGGKKYIIEYFGLYQSTRFPEYTKKVARKVRYYNNLADYVFIPIFPIDFRGKGFASVTKILVIHDLDVEDIH